MNIKTSVTTETEIELTVEMAAQWFCALDDDKQAKFFVEVAKVAATWDRPADNQWWYLGGHLRNCRCSTEEAREMIRGITAGMERSEHGREAAAA